MFFILEYLIASGSVAVPYPQHTHPHEQTETLQYGVIMPVVISHIRLMWQRKLGFRSHHGHSTDLEQSQF